MKSKAGFTLIEITVSIVLVGLIASIAGTSVIMGTRGYLFARENDVITQKAQLALSRLNREIIELSDIKDANSSCIVYESPYGRRAIARVGNSVNLFSPYAPTTCPTSGGDTLVDGVQGLTVYYNPTVNPGPPETATTTWVFNSSTVHDPNSPHHISRLYALRMELTLARQDTGGSVQFVTMASPRNNNNAGGAPSPTSSTPPPQYSGRQCFVTTAAWGDPDHPVVEVLRQFRDQVLIRSAPGEALIRYYNEVGPSLASAIEDKPFVCLIVRLLVLPAAGLAFLALSCPILIPLILLLSWGIAHLILGEIRRRSLRWAPRLQGQRGAMLVTLIATMVVFSALGAIMLGMFGTSALSQASGNNSMRAYYLAESGLRYAASRYVAVALGNEADNEKERNRLLKEDLHNKEFILGSGDGRFKLHIYQYYYPVKSISTSNSQWLDTVVTDSQPSRGFPLSSGNYLNGSWIRIKKQAGDVHEQILGASLLDPNIVQFTRSGPWTGIVEGDEVTPACKAATTTPIVSRVEDGVTKYDLIFQDRTGADIFPEKNGVVMITVQGTTTQRMLAYKKLSLAAYRLQDISDPDGNPLPAVEPGSFIDLTKFMKVESTGTVGQGSSAVSRKVTYFVPIGYARANPIDKSKFQDTMTDTTFANWRTGDDISRIGTLRAGTSYGSTMRVETTQVFNQVPGVNCLKFREFQVGLNWSAAGIPIQQEWLRAGNYLSYDMEVKAYYTLPSAFAKHAIGLTFRLDEQGNALGFTYARGVPGNDANGCDNDGIPWGWLGDIPGYTDYTPVLLFWMKQYPARYGFSPSEVIYENPTGLNPLPPSTRVLKTISSFNWQNGTRVRLTNATGSLPSPLVQGQDYYIRVIGSGLVPKYIYFFPDVASAICSGCTAETYWQNLIAITGQGTASHTMIAQDPVFTKLAHQVMDSGNEYYKIFSSPLRLLSSWATFMVRIIEAPSVSFINGGGATGREILSGDVVYQTSNNLATGTVTAIYQVVRNPVYRSANSSDRNWAGGTSQGMILLERIAGNAASDPTTSPFTAGSKIFVGDQPGAWAGTVGVPSGYTDNAFRVRDNWLLFYVGDPTGTAPADSNPFNNYRGPIAREKILWPPDNVEDTAIYNDNFTLLRFEDYVNSTYCTSFFTKLNSTTGSAGDVLRFQSPDGSMFYSPQSGVVFPTKRAEVGLHAYGNDGNFVEYDDFALQFGPSYTITRQGFMLPIQQ